MENNPDAAHATRRAELEELYRSLPPAGSRNYWQRIEETERAKRLPLEVLARCLRECLIAGNRAEATRIYDLITQRIEDHVKRWAERIAEQTKSGMKPEIRDELQQECRMKLWEELDAEGPTFLLEGFIHTLDMICRHVAHAMMRQNGDWIRPGVDKPTRIPGDKKLNIDERPQGEDTLTLGETLPDVQTANDFEQVEWSDLFRMIGQLPREARGIIHSLYYDDRTQEEVARELGVTDRTVRNRLKAILDKVRLQYQGDPEQRAPGGQP